jgi:hypothetical protein
MKQILGFVFGRAPSLAEKTAPFVGVACGSFLFGLWTGQHFQSVKDRLEMDEAKKMILAQKTEIENKEVALSQKDGIISDFTSGMKMIANNTNRLTSLFEAAAVAEKVKEVEAAAAEAAEAAAAEAAEAAAAKAAATVVAKVETAESKENLKG